MTDEQINAAFDRYWSVHYVMEFNWLDVVKSAFAAGWREAERQLEAERFAEAKRRAEGDQS